MSEMVPKVRFQGFTDDWEQRKLGEMSQIIDTKHATAPVLHEKTQFKMIRTSTVRDGNIFPEKMDSVSEDIYAIWSERIHLKSGDVVFSREAPMGESAEIPEDNNKYFLGQRMVAIRNKSDLDSKFLVTNFLAPAFKKEIRVRNAESTTVANFGISSIKNHKIILPKIEEQQKIGSFFKQLDNLITLHQRKLDLLKEQKKGFLQKMFPKSDQLVPEVRFSGFTDDWEQRKLGEIVKKDTVKNNDLEFHSQDIISVAQMKDATTVRDSSDEYMMTYNKIRFGNIAFEGHANKEFPNGRFVLNDFRDGIVSHIYDVYIFTSRVDSAFMKKYINNPVVMRKILINSTSNARMMNSLNSKEFLKQKLLLPSFDEQQKIGVIFEQLDNLITLHQRKLDLLKEQKKGFLQKMFV